MTMTPQQYLAASEAAYNLWAIASNGTNDQEALYALCDQYILVVEMLLKNAGGHPSTPRPKVRPHT